MTARIPNNFVESADNVIATYDFTDIEEGTGYVNFYAGVIRNNSGNIFRLSRNAFNCSTHAGNSVQRFTRVTVTGGGSTKQIDYDFDTSSFNVPKLIEGKMYCQIPFSSKLAASPSVTEGFVVVTLKKLDVNSVESTIATATSNTANTTNGEFGSGDADPAYYAFDMDCPLTQIKIGEKIRITFEFWGNYISGGNSSWTIAHDPMGHAIAAGSTEQGIDSGESIMLYTIPFRINL